MVGNIKKHSFVWTVPVENRHWERRHVFHGSKGNGIRWREWREQEAWGEGIRRE